MHKLYWLSLAVGLTQAACSSDSKPAATTETGAPATQTATRAQVQRALRQQLPPAQAFRFRASRDTVLRGAQGTEIHFRAGSLALPKGSEAVTMTLREFYTPADMVLAGLSTRAGRRLLETGGMLQIEASAAGRSVKLREGETLRVRMPAQRVEPDMQLFEGKPDAAGQVDWTLAPVRRERGGPVVDTIWSEFPIGEHPYTEAEAIRERRQRLANRNVAADETVDQTAFYEFELANLGWINCDRFWESKQPLIVVGVPADTATTATYLVFKNIRSVLAADSVHDGRVFFRQVPQGAPATIVALKREGEQLQLATQAVRLQPDLAAPALSFRPVTAAQLRAALR